MDGYGIPEVDFITFNLIKLSDPQILQLANYFQNLGFNCYKRKNQTSKSRQEAIARDVNKVMKVVSKKLPGQPHLTSHSFRVGYITQLWKDSKDIEFVK